MASYPNEILTVYRGTTVGEALTESLDDLKIQNEIREELSLKVMQTFDRVILEKFQELPQNQKCKLQGKCSNYNNCDDVWRFVLKQCNIKGDNFLENSESCQIVALDAANNPYSTTDRKVQKKVQQKRPKKSDLGKRQRGGARK